jgi:hypothetical protein
MPFSKEAVFRKIKDGRTAIILGGDSKLYKGMTTNPEIIAHLIRKCAYPNGFPLSLMDVGEYFSELNGRPSLVEEITTLLDTKPGKSSILTTLASISAITEIFTTNMDENIQSFFPTGKLMSIRTDSDVSLAFSKQKRLYRLNGSINDGHNMILTKSQFLNQLALGPKSPIISHLTYNLTTRQFLIIGHDLRQWNFSYYFEQVTEQLGDFREKAYLFADEPDPILESHWNKRNIEIVRQPPEVFLSEYTSWEKTQ